MMKTTMFKHSAMLCLVVSVAAFVSGCGQQPSESSDDLTAAANASPDDHDHSTDDASHGGWWCVEHGIPEEQCSMCSSSAAEELKEKGDWCEDHNRAASQCFICDPSRAEKFAKLYEAKFGHKPPKLEKAE